MNNNTLTLGFLGFGQMGSAIASGLSRFSSQASDGTLRMTAYTPHPDKLRERIASLGLSERVVPCASAEELAEGCDLLLLAVKPYQAEEAAAGIREKLAGKAVISVVNAMGQGDLSRIFGPDVRTQYVMPNTPMKAGAGVALFEEETSLTAEELSLAKELFESVGTVLTLPGRQMKAAASLTGCGPAFFFMAAEALGDAGVKNGLKRADAYRMAAAVMAGAGRLLLETGAHPGELKDGVCSPGGTTIRGVAALEEDGFRAALIHAVDATLK